jgi:hemolysin activation/secretion protein
MKNKLLSYDINTLVATACLISMPLILQADVGTNTGIILQQMKSAEPHIPLSTKSNLTIKQENGKILKESIPFSIQEIQIIGNTYFDTKTLHLLVADAEGKKLSLDELNELTNRITDYYNKNGYPLARAIIPAQTIQDGRVQIQIVEVTYNKIILNNHSRVDDSLLLKTLSPLKAGEPVKQKELYHSLLLLSDIPGVVANSILKAGEKNATTDLTVNVTPTPIVSGNVIVDNYGSRYTGRGRISTTISGNNLFNPGDTLKLNLLSSGKGLNYGRIAYESVVNGYGTQIGGSYSSLRYKLGEPIAFLNAHGTAQVESLWIKHPLIRTQDLNLYTLFQCDNLELHDHTDATSTKTDRHLQNGTLSFNMDMRDTLLSGGLNTLSLGLTSGHVKFEDTDAEQYDAQTANTQGRFSKLNLYLSRLQRLSPKDELQIDFSLQEASTNLDSYAKIIAGGPYSLRGYDVGAIAGDSWYSTTAEIRHTLDPIREEEFQLFAFIEQATITVNKRTWSMGENRATLRDAGVGINWNGPNQWSARAYSAIPIGPSSALVETSDSPRLWVEIRKGF